MPRKKHASVNSAVAPSPLDNSWAHHNQAAVLTFSCKCTFIVQQGRGGALRLLLNNNGFQDGLGFERIGIPPTTAESGLNRVDAQAT